MKVINILLIIICIIYIIYYIANNYYLKENNKSLNNNITVDFVTICYNDKLELDLLKLQAISFKFVDKKFVNNIYILYNDNNYINFNLIRNFYPSYFQDKVKIIYRQDIYKKDKYKSNWRNQQLFKLLIAKYISSKYYIILDGKNHFIRPVKVSVFFTDGKPNMFLHNPGGMIKYYKNCLNYFNIKCPLNNNQKYTFLTVTPQIFITNIVINLINYIEKKEKTKFDKFFLCNRKITEFYLYSTYLIYKKSLNLYNLKKKNSLFIVIMDNPNISWNTYEKKKLAITDNKCKIFGLHRKAVKRMNKRYKKNLIFLYKHFYDKKTMLFIKNNILKI